MITSLASPYQETVKTYNTEYRPVNRGTDIRACSDSLYY